MNKIANLILIYEDTNGTKYEQPAIDLTDIGTLIDPETGEDLELIGYRLTNIAGGDYILIEGGLVQNNPALEVFDLDILDVDSPNESNAHNALDLYERIASHPTACVELTEDLTQLADFVRWHGNATDASQVTAYEAERLTAPIA